MANPPAADVALWTVEYEVDLTAQTAHDFTAGGDGSTLSMGGVTWTAYNEGASDKFETTSSGLEIDPKGDGTSWWANDQDLPYFAAKLDDMMTSLGEDDTVALQLYMDSSPDASAAWDAYGLALWDGTAPSNSNYLVARRLHGVSAKLIDSFVVDENYDQIVEATQQTLFEIVLFPGNSAVASIGVFSGSFPDPLLTSGTYQSYTSLSGILGPGGQNDAVPTWEIPLADARFTILAQRVSSATVLTTTAYKLRVLRRKKE